MRTNPLPHFGGTDAPVPAKTPSPATDIEAFLAASTFFCQQYCARISPEQCQANRAKELFLCGKCTQERPKSAARKKQRGRPAKAAKPTEDHDGTLCPGMPLGKAGAGVERPAQLKKSASQENRGGGVPSPPDPVIMRIFTMVQKRLQEVKR